MTTATVDEATVVEVVSPGCGPLVASNASSLEKSRVARAEKLRRSSEATERIQDMEGELLEQSLRTLVDASMFADLDDDGSPPEEWAVELGEKRAKRRARVAGMALLSAKEAPVGLKIAQQMAVGIMAMRSKVSQGGDTFNVQVVNLMAAPATYPALLEENDEK